MSLKNLYSVPTASDTLAGILNSISTVGAYTEAEYEAVGLIEMLRERLHRIRLGPAALARRVVVLEGLDPVRKRPRPRGGTGRNRPRKPRLAQKRQNRWTWPGESTIYRTRTVGPPAGDSDRRVP